MGKKKVTTKRKPGPRPESLKIEGDWKGAVKTALERGKPPTRATGKEREK
jgi:hypothetical protein